MESCGFEGATPIAEAAALLPETFDSISVSDAANAGFEVWAAGMEGSEGEAVSLGDEEEEEESGVVA